MAQFAPIIMVAGTAYSIYSGMEAAETQKQAASEAERIGRENAANIEAETREEARRLALAQERELGKARAVAGASGLVSTSGTINTFIEDLQEGQAESLAWLNQSGANRARIAKLTGGYTGAIGRAGAETTLAQPIGQGISNVGAAASIAGQQGSWW